jgi:energy-coupling factor transporter transmembrane protein EcfT
MARRIAFHYIPGNSFLHRWDARCKFLGLLIITAPLVHSKISWLILNSGILLSLLFLSRIPVRQFFHDLRNWGIFLFILFLFQILFTPGPPLFSWLPISADGFFLGVFTFWRVGLILSAAVLFTAVTRPRELRDALIWLLKPIPFLHERRIGLMVSLTMRFFSIILDQAEEVLLAHKVRLGDQIKNPFRRAKFLGLPLLRRSLSQAEDITLAVAARGYRDDIPLRLPRMKSSHLIPLLIFLGFLIVLWWFQF